MDSPKLQNFNSKRGQQLPPSLYLIRSEEREGLLLVHNFDSFCNSRGCVDGFEGEMTSAKRLEKHCV